jgi:hypothetical protein
MNWEGCGKESSQPVLRYVGFWQERQKTMKCPHLGRHSNPGPSEYRVIIT